MSDKIRNKGKRIIFCRVNPFQGITGGDIYDARLMRLASGYKGIDTTEFILFHDEPFQSLPKWKRLWRKISASVRTPFQMVKVGEATGADDSRDKKGASMPTRLWFFNSSKAMWFLPSAIRLNRNGCTTLAVTHHPLFLQFDGVKGGIYKKVELAFLRRMKYVVVPSPYTHQLLAQYINPAKLLLLPIPFDRPEERNSDSVSSEPEETGRDCGGEVPILISVATIEPRKGQLDILEGMLRLREAGIESRAVLIGKTVTEEYAERIRRFAAANRLEVTMTGYIDEEEKRRLMSSASVYVSASCAEGYGMSVVEAMMAGVPVVAYNNTSMPMLLGEGRGILCRTGDPLALAEGIKSVLPAHAPEEGKLRMECIAKGKLFALSLPDGKEFNRRWHEILKHL